MVVGGSGCLIIAREYIDKYESLVCNGGVSVAWSRWRSGVGLSVSQNMGKTPKSGASASAQSSHFSSCVWATVRIAAPGSDRHIACAGRTALFAESLVRKVAAAKPFYPCPSTLVFLSPATKTSIHRNSERVKVLRRGGRERSCTMPQKNSLCIRYTNLSSWWRRITVSAVL